MGCATVVVLHVTGVYPGGVKTNIAKSGRHVPEEQALEFNRRARTEPRDAAKVILDAVEKNKQHVFVGMDAKVLQAVKRTAPESTVSFFAWAMSRIRGEK